MVQPASRAERAGTSETEKGIAAVQPSIDRREPPPLAGILVVYVLVLVAALTRWGGFSWEGMIPMAGAVVLAILLHAKSDWKLPQGETILMVIALASMAACVYLSVGKYETMVRYKREIRPGFLVWQQRYGGYGIALRLLLAAAFVLALPYAIRRRQRRRLMPALFLVLLGLAIATRVLIVFSSPRPIIDVHVSQTIGAKGLLLQCAPESRRETMLDRLAAQPAEKWTLQRSRNVYAMQFPSPYFDERRQGPRLDRDGNPRESAWFDHYGYPPLTIYANALSYFLFREVRALWIVCDVFAALCIYLLARRLRPGPENRRHGELATLCFLFMPRSLFVLEQSWTEPLLVAAMGALALALAYGRGAVGVGALLGLWLSAKQYAVVAAVSLLRYLGATRRMLICILAAGATGLLILLPMALWDFGAMWHDVFGFFLGSAPRPDALSIVGMLTRWKVDVPWWVVTPLWLGAVVFFTCAMRRGLSGWLFSAAGTWLVFFALGKQAFMNYFYVILFALLLAAAATPAPQSPQPGPVTEGTPPETNEDAALV